MNFNIISIPRSGHTAISLWLTLQGLDAFRFTEHEHHHNAHRGYSYQATPNTLFLTPHRKNFIIDNKLQDRLKKHPNQHILLDSQAQDFALITEEYNSPLEVDFHLIVLRDCFNNFASLVKQKKRNRKRLWDDGLRYRKAWKSQAREALGKTKYLEQKKVILYNSWCQSREYRKKTCQKLGLPFTDNGFHSVPHNGSGSSFDGIEYDGKAECMKVMDRWQIEDGEAIFHELLDDKEMINLNRRLFREPRPDSYNKYYPWWYRLYQRYKK